LTRVSSTPRRVGARWTHNPPSTRVFMSRCPISNPFSPDFPRTIIRLLTLLGFDCDLKCALFSSTALPFLG
jgi:hypothetical protein